MKSATLTRIGVVTLVSLVGCGADSPDFTDLTLSPDPFSYSTPVTFAAE